MMGPNPTDSSKEECRKILRRMELEAYGAVVSTLRAQGELTKDRRKLLEDLSVVMKISPERHKAEIRRAVNDEKLSSIAERLSGADTELAWAMEGRRVIPLMPRLVRPTHFTSLASAVSKAAMENPRICIPHQYSSNPSSSRDETPARYVRDPDDEDTLSPVMVPIASPDSSCHSNNNLDGDLPEAPSERTFFTFNRDEEKKPDVTPKKPPMPAQPPLMKRPRSPTSQVVNSPVPLPKVRAVSPNCIRPGPRSIAPLQQPPSQLMPRAPLSNTIRPPVQQMPTPVPVSANTAKIRVRTCSPIVQTSVPRPIVLTRPPVTQYSQVQVSQPRPVASPATKQVVQIRAAPASHSSPTNQQSKDVTALRTVQTHTPMTVQTIPNVASGIAKPLPGKANVIVLHKNSPMAKTITTAAREGDRGALNKANFIQKTMSTPTGTKVTFPSNVRIISVPSGANVINSASGLSLNHTALAQKIVTTGNSGAGAQKNVFVLELSNDSVKPIILGDIVPGNLIPEVNGNSTKTNPPTSVSVKEEKEDKGKTNQSEASVNIFSCVETTGGALKIATNEPKPVEQQQDVIISPEEVTILANNGNHVEGQETIIKHEEEGRCAQTMGLDPQTGLLYTVTEGQAVRSEVGQPTVDIFSTAIASADIDMDSSAFANDDTTGGTQLILTDAFDTSSAKS